MTALKPGDFQKHSLSWFHGFVGPVQWEIGRSQHRTHTSEHWELQQTTRREVRAKVFLIQAGPESKTVAQDLSTRCTSGKISFLKSW